MAIDRRSFNKAVTVLYDTREQKNSHILNALEEMGIRTEQRKLDYGDYSFTAGGRDFSLSCVVERKANVDEIYGNIIHDRSRIEKEFYCGAQLAKQFTLLLENVASWDALRVYTVPEWQMSREPQRKQRRIGEVVYTTLRAWTVNDRYSTSVEFVADKAQTAEKMLEIFYYYWRSYKEMTGVRK